MTARARALRALGVLLLVVAAVAPAAPAAAAAHRSPTSVSWLDVPTGSTARLRGLSAVSRNTAWVSGTGGTVLRTTNGGRSWQDVSPGGDTTGLQFRDVEAFDARRAVVLSIGEGGDSRVYRTTDAGRTWQRTFTNDDPAAFYDCMGFWDSRHGLALSDPVGGAFRVLATDDGGASWAVVDPAGMPAALPGEAAFAASGTCLVTAGRTDAWIASGGAASSRVYASTDRGRTWSVRSTPVAASPAGGIFSLAVRGTRDLVAVGGDFTAPTVGTSAAATSPDAGRTWRTVDTGSLDSVQCTADGACWGSGGTGRVAVLRR